DVLLPGVGDQRAVVVVAGLGRAEAGPCTAPVVVGVVGRVAGAHVADIAFPVAVGVRLVQVRDGRAVVARVSQRVSVAVQLVLVGARRAVVAGFAERIAVAVGLAGIRGGGAVVVLSRLGRVEAVPFADSVAVLIVQRARRARIARVARSVSVGV